MQLNVEGMTCAHCERTIQQAVAALGGMALVDVSAGTVDVTGLESEAAVRRAIEEAGYTIAASLAAPITTARPGCCGARH